MRWPCLCVSLPMSTKWRRAQRRARRKFSPVNPSSLRTSCIPLQPSHRQTVQCAFLRTAQSGRHAGYASSSAYRVAKNRFTLYLSLSYSLFFPIRFFSSFRRLSFFQELTNILTRDNGSGVKILTGDSPTSRYRLSPVSLSNFERRLPAILQRISLSRHPACDERGGSTVPPVLMMQRPPDSPGLSLSQTADRRGTYATSRRETRDLAVARLTSMPRIEHEGPRLYRSRDFAEERRNFSPLSRLAGRTGPCLAG